MWLVVVVVRNSGAGQQELLLDMMWTLWPSLSSYGRKAPQFVDLLGYFTLKTPLSSDKKVGILPMTINYQGGHSPGNQGVQGKVRGGDL